MIRKIIFNKKKKVRTGFVVSGILVTVFVSATFYIGLRWKPILKNTLENTVLNVSDSLYNVHFSDISINLFSGSVYLTGIEITPDSSIYQRMITNKTAPENIFSLKIKQLDIRKIKPFKVYFERNLDINNITISEPELIVTYTRLRDRNKTPIDRRTTYEKIKNTLKSAHLNTLFLKEVDFTYIDRSLKTPNITKLKRLSVLVTDILIDSLSQFDNSRFFHAKNILAELNDFSYPTTDSLYYINIGKVSLCTQNKNLIIKTVDIIPRYEEMAFSNLFERQQDRYRIHFDSIKLEGINYPMLIDYRTIAAEKLSLNNGDISVFLNRAKPKKLIDKGLNYPHIALKKVNWDINADTVLIKKTNIRYSEYEPSTKSRGTISFNDFNGKLFNVTNDSSSLVKNRFIYGNLQASLLGKGSLSVDIRLDMLDKNGAFFYKGYLENMPMPAFNPVSKPLGKVIFSSGQIERLDFSVKGNLQGGGGMVKVIYKDLNVILLRQNKETKTFKRMGLVSIIANALIIKENNPAKGEKVRVSYPYYARSHDASFFNVMWKVVFIGFKETIGITKQQEANVKVRADLMKERKQRREARKLRKKQLQEDNNSI